MASAAGCVVYSSIVVKQCDDKYLVVSFGSMASAARSCTFAMRMGKRSASASRAFAYEFLPSESARAAAIFAMRLACDGSSVMLARRPFLSRMASM